MEISQQPFLEKFYKHLLKLGKGQSTAEAYSRDAKGFLNYLEQFRYPIKNLESSLFLSYQEHLWSQDVKPNTIRRSLIGIRQYFRFLMELKEMSTNPFAEIPLPTRDETIDSKIEHVDILKLISEASAQTCKIKSSRDAALVSLLSFEGLKISELITLQWSDFIVNQHLGTLRITGSRARVVPLCNKSTKWILGYQTEIKKNLPQNEFPHLHKKMFLAFKGRDQKPIPQITRHGLKFMLYELGKLNHIDKLNSESLRHYAIRYHIYLGRTPEEIMDHFGLRRLGNIAKHFAKKTNHNRIKSFL